jgi:hypothetical protein
MDEGQIRGDLERLHAELRKSDTGDEGKRETIRTLTADVGELLGRGENGPHHYQGLRERLGESVAQLEASHPEATLLMRQVIDSLSYLGI